jgi:hypothetical protein
MPLKKQRMDGYTHSEYHNFSEDEEEDEDEDDTLKKTKIKYTILKEEEFIDDE